MTKEVRTGSGTRVACRILVVDDDDDTRSALADLLEHEGFGVRTAANGVEALAAMRSEQPALVLLDLLMPELDGFEVLRVKRDDPAIASIPVIVLTAWRGDALDVDVDVVAKPFDLDALLTRMRARLCRTASTGCA